MGLFFFLFGFGFIIFIWTPNFSPPNPRLFKALCQFLGWLCMYVDGALNLLFGLYISNFFFGLFLAVLRGGKVSSYIFIFIYLFVCYFQV